MAEYASKGVAGAGLGLGIAGTALGVLNGGNLLGGLLGGGMGGCNQDTRQIAQLEAELAREKSERYADSIGIATYKAAVEMSNAEDAKINANYKELAQAIAELDKKEAVNAANLACFQDGVRREFKAVRDEFGCALALEGERRVNGDQNLMCYVNATFVPGQLVMPASSVCPEPMSRYNSWTAPTTTDTTTTP